MTDRLSTLLHDAAHGITVPAPRPGPALRAGRGLRRRRAAGSAAAVLAVVGVVAAGSLLATRLGGARTLPATPPPAQTLPPSVDGDYAWSGAFVADGRLRVGDRELPWAGSVRAVRYTSAGVVVQQGSPSSAVAGRDLSLVTADGKVRRLDVRLGFRLAGFEPDSPRMAFVQAADGKGGPTQPLDAGPSQEELRDIPLAEWPEPSYGEIPARLWDVVVRDVSTDREVARVQVRAKYSWAGFDAPPAALDGDEVWVHGDDGWTAVNWRTGAARTVPESETVSVVSNGTYVVRGETTATLRAMANDATLSTVPSSRGDLVDLSPDGNHLLVDRDMVPVVGGAPGEYRSDPETRVYDVRTGRFLVVDRPGAGLPGWTPDGKLQIVRGGAVWLCSPTGGDCTRPPNWMVADPQNVRLGGRDHTS